MNIGSGVSPKVINLYIIKLLIIKGIYFELKLIKWRYNLSI